MRRRHLLNFLLLVPVLASAQKRAITAKDIFDFHWIGDTQLSPVSTRLIFVEASVAPAHDGYETALYMVDTAAPNATPAPLAPHASHDTSPRWSPDGTRIVFLRSVERDGKLMPPQLYVMDASAGASPVRLTDLPKGVSSPRWSPDGQSIAIESLTPQDPAKAKLESAEKARATGDEAHISDVRIIDRSTYRFNGEGFLDPGQVAQLYLISLPHQDGSQDPPLQLTGGRYGVSSWVWSASKNWIFYTSTHEDEPVYDRNDHNSIYGFAVPAAGSHSTGLPPTGLTADLKLQAESLSLSPDGKHFAFHAASLPPSQGASHLQSDLWTLDLTWSEAASGDATRSDNGAGPAVSGAPRNLTAGYAYEMGSGVGGDNVAPRGNSAPEPTWTADGTRILDIAGFRGSALLLSVNAASSKVSELTQPHQAVLNFATNSSGIMIALISNPVMIGDLFSIGAPKSQTRLTSVNETLFSQLDLAMPRDLQVQPTHHAADLHGEAIDTFILLPPGAPTEGKPSAPFPAILNIHGGPHSAYGWIFDQEMLFLAARGYTVIYPNPRGSTTYGEGFANIIMNNYPGDDFHDLMDSVEAAVKLGYADPNKLGVTGGSGGGLLTDWTVTQTDRFKAAVAQRDIVDWAAWWYTADISGFHQSFYPDSPPFDHLDLYRAKSPLTYVNNLKTPMMFILGDADYRTPPAAGGEVFFRALKYKCIPTVMVRFPRESHELSRSGEPWHRVERMENIVDWFDLYLMGKPEPQYNTTQVEACHTH